MPRKSFIWKIPTKDFSRSIVSSTTWTEVAKRYCTHTGNIHTLQARARKDGLDTSHFIGRSWSKGLKCPNNSHPQYKLQDLLTVSKHTIGNQRLKKRILQEKLTQNECYTCGLAPMWNGRPLSLHLAHLNGDKLDNTIENLVLMCPNCHSQSKKEQKYATLVFLRNCEKCNKEIPDDDELCKKCNKHRRPSLEKIEREVAILGVDGAARVHHTDEKTIKMWLNSPK